MEDFIKRIVEERNETKEFSNKIDLRLSKLEEFINSGKYDSLSKLEKKLLNEQFQTMIQVKSCVRDYIGDLTYRIEFYSTKEHTNNHKGEENE